MTLFGDMGFTVRSSEQALIHMIGVPFKKGNLDTEIPIEERLHPYGKTKHREKTAIYKSRTEKWNRLFSLSSQKEPTQMTP